MASYPLQSRDSKQHVVMSGLEHFSLLGIGDLSPLHTPWGPGGIMEPAKLLHDKVQCSKENPVENLAVLALFPLSQAGSLSILPVVKISTIKALMYME